MRVDHGHLSTWPKRALVMGDALGPGGIGTFFSHSWRTWLLILRVLLGPAFELLYSTLPNGIVAVEISPPATSPMSSTRFKGTMLMGGLASTIDVPV